MSALERLKQSRQSRSGAAAQPLPTPPGSPEGAGPTLPQQSPTHRSREAADQLPRAGAAKGSAQQPRSIGAHRPPVRQPCPQQPLHAAGWETGPTNEAGLACELSDRPLLCAAAHWAAAEVVVGSSDHALYAVDVRSGRKKRTLYTRACGHTEWVTCVCYLPDGRILSGGMDSDLWLWPAAGTRGSKVTGHSGPVSAVAPLGSSGRAVSAGYDATLLLWDVGGSQAQAVGALAGPHSAAVLTCAVKPEDATAILSGDRRGAACVWDVPSAAASWRQDGCHRGHVTSGCWLPDSCGSFATGGQDGWVRVWDSRSRGSTAQQPVHSRPGQGQGAVGDLQTTSGQSPGPLLVSCGADKTLQCLDPRMSYAARSSVSLPDFPYSLAMVGPLAVVGCGDGAVCVVHVQRGELLYCLGANRAAVRALAASPDKLVAAGDDGACLVYSFAA